MQNLIKRVYTDWLPTSLYEKIDGFELELYYGEEDNIFVKHGLEYHKKIFY